MSFHTLMQNILENTSINILMCLILYRWNHPAVKLLRNRRNLKSNLIAVTLRNFSSNNNYDSNFFVRKSIQVFLSRMLVKDLSKVGFVKNLQGWKFVLPELGWFKIRLVQNKICQNAIDHNFKSTKVHLSASVLFWLANVWNFCISNSFSYKMVLLNKALNVFRKLFPLKATIASLRYCLT